MPAKHMVGDFSGFFREGIDFFDLKVKTALRCAQHISGVKKALGPLEIACYVFCPHKKTSGTFRISGAVITVL